MPSKSTVGGYRHGRVPRAVREQQLLDLAEPLFIEHGYAGFSIEDLCQAAKVSRPVVYDHFGTKDGIYLACLRRIRDELDAVLVAAAGPSPATAAEAIEQAADAFFAIIERDPRRWSLVYGGTTVLTGPIADDLYALRSRTIDRIADVVTRFAPTAGAEAIATYAHFISGAAEQLGRWWLRNPDTPRDRVVANYVAFATGALGQLR
ncbi:TetR/AcrR family transcriptional regulator [Kutzneria sp. NPDC052558]|uniref:TetR/AcrR family transcriptional regulator n=1 Tax=Kutzneria sp. NPDC052558 TaxID=3364121 RepID=UPI0037C8BA72